MTFSSAKSTKIMWGGSYMDREAQEYQGTSHAIDQPSVLLGNIADALCIPAYGHGADLHCQSSEGIYRR